MIWADIGTGLLVNVISSIIFLALLMYFFRARFDISDEIAKEIRPDGTIIYWFKIINKSRYTAFDLNISIDTREIKTVNDPSAITDEMLEAIIVSRPLFPTVPKYADDKTVALTKQASHCIQVHTKNDLDAIFNSGNYTILLQVSLKHGVSGLSRAKEKIYTKSAVKKGDFLGGNGLKVNTD
ncbi:MAG: hypothetical protein MUF12_00435 [Sediminibacterium sp.]|jgi:hypothetical protein|nr:hypothetical protein [Sediminibacterium sp.]